jgi:general secretion pathway protein I
MRRAEAPFPRGFTLLETLVALGVFALAAMALFRLVGLSLTTASRIDERALAAIVAANRIVDAQSAARAPALGRSQGVEANGGLTWRWTMTVVAAPDPRLVQIDVSVAAPSGGEAARLTGFRRLP